jgi:hypothetical protein
MQGNLIRVTGLEISNLTRKGEFVCPVVDIATGKVQHPRENTVADECLEMMTAHSPYAWALVEATHPTRGTDIIQNKPLVVGGRATEFIPQGPALFVSFGGTALHMDSTNDRDGFSAVMDFERVLPVEGTTVKTMAAGVYCTAAVNGVRVKEVLFIWGDDYTTIQAIYYKGNLKIEKFAEEQDPSQVS